jgi:serine/threonine protein phosphatase PrpC
MRLECVTRTHVGCRRKINEDSLLAHSDLGLWAVADGMGGHDAGEVASALLVDLLGAGLKQASLPARIAAAQVAMADANERLVAMAQTSDEPRTIGSTIVLMAMDAHEFSCLWAGDSRAYLVRRGAIQQLTRDHSLVQQLVDSGDLDSEEAAQHPNANVITRAVGAAPDLALDRIEGEVRTGDVFLLASDGLTRLLSDEELLGELKDSDLETAAGRLLDTCLKREAPDNVTFIIVKVR